MKRVRVVSFDVEGTLTSHRFSDLVWERKIPECYARKRGIGFERAREHVKKEYGEVGDGRLEWYDIRYWFNRFGLGGDWEKLLSGCRHEIAVYPEVPSVLETLSKRYTLVTASNSAREFVNLEIEKIEEHFTRVFSATSDFKQLKTTGFYSKVCNVLGVKPEEMVHVGDNWKFDYTVPRRLGIKAFYLDRTGRKEGRFVVKDLKEFEKRCLQLVPVCR